MNYDFESDRPIYIQLVEKLRTQIVSGELKKGEKIQSVRELAINAKVNPNTMQRALAELENEGLLYTERTSGRYVTTNEKNIKKAKEKLAKKNMEKFIIDMRNMGLNNDEIVSFIIDYIKEEK